MKKAKFIPLIMISFIALTGCEAFDKILSFVGINKDETNDASVAVTGVTLDKTTLGLEVGAGEQLTATVEPENAANKELTWTTADASVATVENGYVSAVGVGTTFVTVTTTDGKKTAQCEVTVSTPASEKTVVIRNMSSSVVNISANKTKACPGDVVTFVVTSKSGGYDVDEVNATDSNGATVQLTKTANGYSYNLPSDGIIEVSATVTGKDIKVYVIDEHSLIKDGLYQSVNGKQEEKVTVTGTESGVSYFQITYGAKITLKLVSDGKYTPLGINLDGEEIKCDEDGNVEWMAVLQDFSDFFFSLQVLAKAAGPVEGEYEIEIKNSTHLIAECFLSNNLEMPISSVDQNQIVVIKIKSEEPDRYTCRSVVVKYYTSTETFGSPNTLNPTYDASYEGYRFKVPYIGSKKMTIEIAEADNSLLKGIGVTGSYLVLPTSLATRGINELSTIELSIEGSGHISYKRTPDAEPNEDYVVSYTEEELRTASYCTLRYGDGFVIIGTDNSTTGYSSSFGSYDYICVLKENDSDSIDEYSVVGERFKIDNTAYVIATFYHNDKPFNSLLLTYTKKDYSTEGHAYFGCDIEMILGKTVQDNKAMYYVSKNGENIIGVSYDSDGGIDARMLIEAPMGKYVDKDDNALVIINHETAMYKNETYSLDSVDQNGFVISNKDLKITGTLNQQTKEFAVVETQQIVSNLPPFAGKVFFSNKVWDDWYEYYTAMNCAFSDFEGDNITGRIKWGSTDSSSHLFYFTGVYDLNTKTLTLTITRHTTFDGKNVSGDEGRQLKVIVSDQTLTFKTNISNVYSTNGAVLKCSDFHI